MQRTKTSSYSQQTTLLLGAMAAFLVIVIILFPDKAFQASLQGLTIWWEIVFPAMLPFLIVSEILVGFGVVQAFGTLLEPLMRLLFRIPGVGGWALAMGCIAGFPAGAKIAATLRQKGVLSQIEAERLVSLSHLGSPILLVTVVGVGFLHNAELGIMLAIIHYASAITVGIVLRIRRSSVNKETAPLDSENLETRPRESSTSTVNGVHPKIGHPSLLIRALAAMREAYLHDGRAFGKLLGDSVSSSLQTLMIVGGYIMIFSVMINVIELTGIVNELNTGSPLITGLLEIHLGSYDFSQFVGIPMVWKLSLISAVLGWGGFSSHAQVRSLTQGTDLRYGPFFFARLLHAVFAFVLTFCLWRPLNLLLSKAEATWLQHGGKSVPFWAGTVISDHDAAAWIRFIPMLLQSAFVFAVLLLASLLVYSLSYTKR